MIIIQFPDHLTRLGQPKTCVLEDLHFIDPWLILPRKQLVCTFLTFITRDQRVEVHTGPKYQRSPKSGH